MLYSATVIVTTSTGERLTLPLVTSVPEWQIVELRRDKAAVIRKLHGTLHVECAPCPHVRQTTRDRWNRAGGYTL